MGLFKKHNDPVKETEKNLVHEEVGMEHDIQADVDAVMKSMTGSPTPGSGKAGRKLPCRY